MKKAAGQQQELQRLRRRCERERRARLEAEAIAERFTRDALHDPLTGLANRALFMDRLEHAVAGRSRNRRALAVLVMDLDGFKEINDSLGHAAGDELLCAVAVRLNELVRSVDTVARLGGDEFALLIEDVTKANRSEIAERIKRALAIPFDLHGQPHAVRGSVGIALSNGEHDASELLRRADMAMYAAKRDSAASHALFETGMLEAMVVRLEMKSDLQRALRDQEFVLCYQPIVEISRPQIAGRIAGRVVGMEALIRWNRPGAQLVTPAEFIPLAEETGLIVPMGWWVLEESCRQFHCWRDAYPDEPGLVLHVNISAQQLHDPEAASKVKAALTASDIPPQAVILELTESSIMRDIDRSIQALSLLTSLGVHLGIDDFGTGYSSLNYLRMLPATTLKIDKSFVDEVTDNDQGAALVHAIINFGAALDLTIVAEGVESRAQATRLAELGCVCAQGYYFSRPLDAAGMDVFLAANARRAGETSVR